MASMKLRAIFVGLCLLGSTEAKRKRYFPHDFFFGAATSAHQIEGGWNADDKGESIWDHLTHNHPKVIHNASNADIAADSYHNYRRDVDMMRELGVNMYRFSLSWTRILPNGFTNRISKAGIRYYNNLINEMLTYNITPMVTLYNWDLPQRLQDLGGFSNPLISDWFEDYARIAFKYFGDRVKHWVTFNKPGMICYFGYDSTQNAPRLNATGIGVYLCAKNLLMAHAKAYHAYHNDFKADKSDGVVGISLDVPWFGPMKNKKKHLYAAELRRQFAWGLYAEPIFSQTGGFPKELTDIIAERSREQGYSRSRMPAFTKKERFFILNSSDFFGVNHYTSYLITTTRAPYSDNDDDVIVVSYVPRYWRSSASSWLKLAPHSLFNAIMHLKQKYNDAVFYVTENGWSSRSPGDLYDDDRVQYIRAAMENVLDCISAGVKLRGYMYWSLMDNFQWTEGYSERFGLYRVDFNDPARTRTARKSAFIYKHIIKHRSIDYSYRPKSLNMRRYFRRKMVFKSRNTI